jgi:hypothetical protein
VTRTGHRFRLDDPPDAAALVSRASGVAPYPVVVRVAIDAPPEVVSGRVPPTVALVEAHPEDPGATLLTAGGYDLLSLAGHLVTLDLPFRAIEPPELGDLLRKIGQRLVDGHPAPAPPP